MRTAFPFVASVAMACASGFPAIDRAGLPEPAAFPNAKYVVLLDEDHVRFRAGKDGKAEALVTERWRVKLLKSVDLPPVAAFYNSTFTEIVSMAGRSILPDGTERRLDVSEAFDRPSFDSSVLFSDTRVRQVNAPLLPPGSIFETEIVTRQKDIEPWVLHHTFGGEVPVLRSRVVVEAPQSWSVRWAGQAPEGSISLTPAREALEDGVTRLVFEERDVKAPSPEPSAPPTWMRHRRLALRLDAWTENGGSRIAPPDPEALSRWRYDSYREKAELTPELEAVAREVLAGVPEDPTQRARALYEYACRRIQYCAVEVGYGGWVPHAAKDVHAQRWGDCKDKATYLHALLKVAGIESSPTIIYSHQGWPRPFELPSLGANFNHVILAVRLPQGTVYADPTTRAVPFGELPWNDADATVLEVVREGAPLKKTPPTSPDRNVERHVYELTLDEAGAAAGTFRVEAVGDNAQPFKYRALYGTGKIEPWVRGQLWLRGVEVSSARLDDVQDFGGRTTVSGSATLRSLVGRGLGTASLFRLSDALERWSPDLADKRVAPFAWKWLATTEVRLQLTLPAGAGVAELPTGTRLESPIGLYELEWKREGQVLTVTRRFRRTQRVIEPADFPLARQVARQLDEAEASPVVIRFGGAR
ncbi:MAG: DUF3857 domain-containing protein [Myxococcaceae bacterium]|nr:DUF3857 domain-containing protein [Myxococcaceae bacterium]